jgi:hypothetical protein
MTAQDIHIFLPATPAMLVDPAKARAAIEGNRQIRRSHLFPLYDATASFACSLMNVFQGCETFEPPRSPFIVVIGDDLALAWGPAAFGADSLDRVIKAAGHCVLITSGPDPFPYRIAATAAARDRKNVLLIETRPNQQLAWLDRIEALRGKGLPMTQCVPEPESAA